MLQHSREQFGILSESRRDLSRDLYCSRLVNARHVMLDVVAVVAEYTQVIFATVRSIAIHMVNDQDSEVVGIAPLTRERPVGPDSLGEGYDDVLGLRAQRSIEDPGALPRAELPVLIEEPYSAGDHLSAEEARVSLDTRERTVLESRSPFAPRRAVVFPARLTRTRDARCFHRARLRAPTLTRAATLVVPLELGPAEFTSVHVDAFQAR